MLKCRDRFFRKQEDLTSYRVPHTAEISELTQGKQETSMKTKFHFFDLLIRQQQLISYRLW